MEMGNPSFFLIFILGVVVFVECTRLEEGSFFEGDILLTPDQLEDIEENSFASSRSKLWHSPDGSTQKVIEYAFTPEIKKFPQAMRIIREAIRDYEKYTCLRFQERNERPKTKYHMYFMNTPMRCFSNLGRLEGGNRIGLGSICWEKGIAIHEIGHALGFYHEQSRPDRDDYLTINWKNIDTGNRINFKKYTDFDVYSYGTPYDYESIMHYGPYAFTKIPGKYSIITKDPSKQNLIGQRKGFSRIDVIQLNRMYCDSKWTTPKPATLPPDQCNENSVPCKRLAKFCTNTTIQKNCPITCKVC